MRAMLAAVLCLALTLPALGQAKKSAPHRPAPTTVPTVAPTAIPPSPVPPNATPYVWQQEPTAFRGLAWGSTEKELKKAYGIGMCFDFKTKIPNARERTCMDGFNLGSVSIKAYDELMNDRFVEVIGTFDSDAYSTVKLAFLEKYGPPKSFKTSTVQNRMNASFEQEELEWDGPNVHISLSRLAGKVTEGQFVVATQPYRQASMEAIAAETKKLKDAL